MSSQMKYVAYEKAYLFFFSVFLCLFCVSCFPRLYVLHAINSIHIFIRYPSANRKKETVFQSRGCTEAESENIGTVRYGLTCRFFSCLHLAPSPRPNAAPCNLSDFLASRLRSGTLRENKVRT